LQIFALSLELLVGSTGLVCFGQAAFFGIGAYATVLLSPGYDGPAALLVLLPASVRWPRLPTRWRWVRCRLRTKGVYFIMVTLAFAQMAYYVVHDTPLGGGTDGIYLNSQTSASRWLLDLDRVAGVVRLHLCRAGGGVRTSGGGARARVSGARWRASG
jgi:branched-chain amino acid transport system permease protein